MPVLPKRQRTLRELCKRLVASKEFDRVILAVIGVNCITLLVNNPLEVSSERGMCLYVRCSQACTRGVRGGAGECGRVLVAVRGGRWAKRAGCELWARAGDGLSAVGGTRCLVLLPLFARRCGGQCSQLAVLSSLRAA